MRPEQIPYGVKDIKRVRLENRYYVDKSQYIGKRMIFHHATLYKDGEKLELNEVELIARPRFKLIWSTGSWDLTEIPSPIL